RSSASKRTSMANQKDATITGIDGKPLNLRNDWNLMTDWVSDHAVQIMAAAGAAIVIYLLLAALRSFGTRIKGKPGDHLGLSNVLGRTFARTTQFFMVMVSARLVAGYADPPAALYKTIAFLFTTAAVFQAAVWL